MSVHKLLPVCMTAVFLGAKLEETPLNLRAICSVFDRLLKRQAGVDTTPLAEKRFQSWSETVKSCEGVMLQALGFELYNDLPHKFILHFINYLHPTARDAPHTDGDATHDSAAATAAALERELWSSLNQRCWSTLNDSLLSSRVLFQYASEVIACAAIHLAACELQITLPHEWWRLFDVATHQLHACTIDMTRLYALLRDATTPLQYTPTDPNDNAQTNELIVYAPRSRAQRIAERQQQLEAQRQSHAQTGGVGTQAPSPSPSPTAMET